MSSYVVNDETISKVVSYLFANANGPSPAVGWKHTKLYKMGFDVFTPKTCAELAHKMFDLNVFAVNSRYGKGDAKKFRLLDFKYQFVPASLIEVIKALKAWLYQCTEGNVPDLALFKAMEEVLCLLCIEFVEQTEEYEVAPWG